MNSIEYPKKPSEAEIQFELCTSLRQKGFDARLEVRAQLNGKVNRFDIVVFADFQPQAIVECKSYSRRYRIPRNERQLFKPSCDQ